MTYTLIPGQSHTASEEETMSMIRSVLTEGGDTAPEKVAEAPMQKQQVQAFVERTTEAAPRRRADDLPELAAVEEEARPRKKRSPRGLPRLLRPVSALIQRVRTFQPTTRHIGLALMALLFVVRPHWFVIGAVLALMLVVGTFLTLGADRVWHGILAWLDRIEARNPARAAELRGKLDTFAYRWDSVLDIFPDGMVDSLYMPDFQSMQQADIEHQQVVSDRLDRMAQES
ncbi:hypothetical protein [Tateyamaria sp. ANG-S1]|uniref:hypothetical protein n=1 Tax=Tateyamaria sp. ANG-S1 TaxID=1577905 RepID=UPI00057EADDE|nr:hypothetical protein [Tateyamaria sp. ANG-S1]KIC45437.1 hypothetical protein RA29_21010 [Tateyamaria sp. ANG-S1]